MVFKNSTPHYLKSLSFLVLLSFSSFLCVSQVLVEWEKSYGGNNVDIPYSIKQTLDNGFVVAGTTASTNGYVSKNNGWIDYWVIKTDSEGKLLWEKSYGGSNQDYAYDVLSTSDGGYLLSGYSKSNDGDIADSKGDKDFWLLKLDANGDLLWQKSLGGSSFEEPATLIETYDSNYIVAGYTNSSDGDVSENFGGTDYWVVKFNASGSIMWEKTFGGSGTDMLKDLYQTQDSGLVMVGSSSSGDGQKTIKLSYTDYWIVKTDSLGEIVWEKSFGRTGFDIPESIIQTKEGNYVIAGKSGKDAYNTRYDFCITKLDSNGNVIWDKSYGGDNDDEAYALLQAEDGGFILAGETGSSDGNVAFNKGSTDYWMLKLNNDGELLWEKSLGGKAQETAYSLLQIEKNNLVIAGYSASSNGDVSSNNGDSDFWLAKLNVQNVLGKVFFDIDKNGVKDYYEKGIDGISLLINPGGIIAVTGDGGKWALDSLPEGDYTVTVDTSGAWKTLGPASQNFSISNSSDFAAAPQFGMENINPCSEPLVSLYMWRLRRCFSDQQIMVKLWNRATATNMLENAFIDVELGSLIELNSADIPFSEISQNTYRFAVEDLRPGQSTGFKLYTTISCETKLGQTLCAKASLVSTSECMLDTVPSYISNPELMSPDQCSSPYDSSHLVVDGWCANDSVHFSITNAASAGHGNMQCFMPVNIYINDTLAYTDSVKLNGGEKKNYAFPSRGETWVLRAEQHPLHPGNSHPIAFVEACGSNLDNWIPGLAVNQPHDDADDVVDIHCTEIRGSYDPNDKSGFPMGIGDENAILPNQQLQYIVRFQNTGNDTAFTVVIRDTISPHLDIFSLSPGVTSHTGKFRMYGARILEWRFEDILLPDSTTNEAGSHGFVSYLVKQKPNLDDGTIINNRAGIYFDYNLPIITNTTTHTISREVKDIPLAINNFYLPDNPKTKVYPNPSNGLITLLVENNKHKLKYQIFDIYGRQIQSGFIIGEQNQLNLTKCNSGFYLICVEGHQPIKFIRQ